ncbi:hypothetical protein DFR31_1919 [Alkalispirillum mobile]|uniref:Uncharacterized protein n=1 Tax=Alkalispirillum mobile TaxID=85925 RepID=A0A498C126_9GAMM|nr:hypothetical protein [Alkalispirillum mobile]RLK48807.1 hypothetical protein DFR31_1919 [Alkalispirillum mobile]
MADNEHYDGDSSPLIWLLAVVAVLLIGIMPGLVGLLTQLGG